MYLPQLQSRNSVGSTGSQVCMGILFFIYYEVIKLYNSAVNACTHNTLGKEIGKPCCQAQKTVYSSGPPHRTFSVYRMCHTAELNFHELRLFQQSFSCYRKGGIFSQADMQNKQQSKVLHHHHYSNPEHLNMVLRQSSKSLKELNFKSPWSCHSSAYS